ncbi:hypothetical protein GCM10017691_23490 [Pseudonocardia petroleophila]|uniref:DUF732 domain-containing protein n=1 Tax=Pseudonocardia petroleophila TaxID=37331 RepID=A0A7G7MFZ3_9PSEU|nr:DUF732 domain-containing protein [Pseudonocardia petroleophila]QNG51704.1 DUF732 domain-containing protein [Pseudonocardia petroleophila]
MTEIGGGRGAGEFGPGHDLLTPGEFSPPDAALRRRAAEANARAAEAAAAAAAADAKAAIELAARAAAAADAAAQAAVQADAAVRAAAAAEALPFAPQPDGRPPFPGLHGRPDPAGPRHGSGDGPRHADPSGPAFPPPAGFAAAPGSNAVSETDVLRRVPSPRPGPAPRPEHDAPEGGRAARRRAAAAETTVFDVPAFDGPAHDGPRHDGPRHDGPRHDGPRHDGPRHDGAYDDAGYDPAYDAGYDDAAYDTGYDAAYDDAHYDEQGYDAEYDDAAYDDAAYDDAAYDDAAYDASARSDEPVTELVGTAPVDAGSTGEQPTALVAAGGRRHARPADDEVVDSGVDILPGAGEDAVSATGGRAARRAAGKRRGLFRRRGPLLAAGAVIGALGLTGVVLLNNGDAAPQPTAVVETAPVVPQLPTATDGSATDEDDTAALSQGDPLSDRGSTFLSALREAGVPTSRGGAAEVEAAELVCQELGDGVDEARIARALPASLPTVTRAQAADLVEIAKENYCTG